MSVPQPVFILASPRSFTSLTCAMLGQHPELYGVPEINLFIANTLEQLLQDLKDQSRFRKAHGILRTVAQLYAGEQTMLSVQMAQRWLLRHIHWNTGDIYQELCSKVQPLHIIDKSPAYSLELESLNRIRKTFPNAHFLHLVRHPRSQGESVLKLLPQTRLGKDQRRKVVGPPSSPNPTLVSSLDPFAETPTVDFQFLWYRMQWMIMQFLSTVPAEQQMRLRGEDVLSNPRLYFEKICRWLGLSWNESAFEAMLHPEDSPFACFGPYGAQFGNDVNFLRSPIFKQKVVKPSQLEGPLPWRRDGEGFHPLVMQLAQELGYE